MTAYRTAHAGGGSRQPAARSPTIVNETSPTVDAIFTGHTHQQYAWDGPVPGQPGTDPADPADRFLRRERRQDRADRRRDTNAVTAYRQRNVARVTTAD